MVTVLAHQLKKMSASGFKKQIQTIIDLYVKFFTKQGNIIFFAYKIEKRYECEFQQMNDVNITFYIVTSNKRFGLISIHCLHDEFGCTCPNNCQYCEEIKTESDIETFPILSRVKRMMSIKSDYFVRLDSHFGLLSFYGDIKIAMVESTYQDKEIISCQSKDINMLTWKIEIVTRDKKCYSAIIENKHFEKSVDVVADALVYIKKKLKPIKKITIYEDEYCHDY